MGKKILIIRPLTRTAFEVAGYCQNALNNLNYEVRLFDFCPDKISSGIKLPFIKSLETALVTKLLFKEISKFRPGLVLVVKADSLTPQIIAEAKRKFDVPWANYWIDDPLWISVSSSLSPFYDYFFTSDSECVSVHEKAGCPKVKFLTFACDEEVHRRVNLNKDELKKYSCDVSFSGVIVPERENILKEIADFDLKIWSPAIVQYHNEQFHLTQKPIDRSSPIYVKFSGRHVWGSEMVKVFNASKIALNIHSQKGAATNLRTFEVTASAAFLLTDKRNILSSLFKIGEEIVCFESPQELRNIIAYFLKHPKERQIIAQRGQQRAYRQHTYVHRMKELLSHIW